MIQAHADVQIPKPTGTYAVGSISYHLTNKDQPEFHDTDAAHPYRELMIHLYYPALPADTAQKMPYLADILSYVKDDIAKNHNKDRATVLYLDNLTTHAYPQAAINTDKAPYPVILFTHGTGTVSGLHTMLLEDLASHGFIVVSIDHPYTALAVSFPNRLITPGDNKTAYSSFPDYIAKEIAIRLSDISFIIKELKRITNDPDAFFFNMLDMSNIGLLGHSFGGSVMTRLCEEHKEFKAGCSIDGPIYDGAKPLHNPFMFIRGAFLNGSFFTDQELKHFNLSKEDGLMISRGYEAIQSLLQTAKQDIYYISLPTVQHMDFSDYGLFLSDGKEAISIYPCIIDFFKKYL